MTYSYGFYFAQPGWLVACLLLVPIIWLGRRYLAALGPVRRTLAIILRCLVTLILVAMLARPMLTRSLESATTAVVSTGPTVTSAAPIGGVAAQATRTRAVPMESRENGGMTHYTPARGIRLKRGVASSRL